MHTEKRLKFADHFVCVAILNVIRGVCQRRNAQEDEGKKRGEKFTHDSIPLFQTSFNII